MYLLFADARYGLLERVLAWVLLVTATWPMARYAELETRTRLPLLEIVCLMHVPYYSLAIIFESELRGYWGIIPVSESGVRTALVCAILAVVCLQIGWAGLERVAGSGWIWRLSFPLSARRGVALAGVVTLGWTVLSLLWIREEGPPVGLAQLVTLLCAAPFPVALLADYAIARRSRGFEGLLWATAGLFAFLGVARAMLLEVLMPFAVIGTVQWFRSGQFPRRLFALGLCLFAIAQPVKLAFRTEYWFNRGNLDAPILERPVRYFELALDYWTSPGHSLDDVSVTTSRFNGLLAFGQVVDEVPDRIPYQYGSTYSYVLYSFVPRALWPDKPLAQQTNHWYAVEFGLNTTEGTRTCMIGIRQLLEAYANFGVLGVPIVFLILGMILQAVNLTFGHEHAGEGGRALYAALTFQLASIETNTASVYAGLIQAIVVYTVVARLLRSRSAPALRPAPQGRAC
jgi:hypothetical protein